VAQAKRIANEVANGTKRSRRRADQFRLRALQVEQRMIALVQQIMRQTKARVFNNDVHAADKIVSLFEPVKQKYRLLFSPKRVRRPGPKGPTKELIDAVVEMKRRNRTWGCKRIAQQIALAFGLDIDKDVVRRILATHFHPESGSAGPSWLSFIGHSKASLWSLDLFRCESTILRTYWVLVMMDRFTRRIVGFAVHGGVMDGATLCRMFNRVIHAQALPKYMSSDHDRLYRFHQWQANLCLEIQEIKTVPYVALFASVRRETDRNDQTGILGPNATLDRSGSGAETRALSEIFQSTACAFGLERRTARC
jgi:transposase InsO family protein